MSSATWPATIAPGEVRNGDDPLGDLGPTVPVPEHPDVPTLADLDAEPGALLPVSLTPDPVTALADAMAADKGIPDFLLSPIEQEARRRLEHDEPELAKAPDLLDEAERAAPPLTDAEVEALDDREGYEAMGKLLGVLPPAPAPLPRIAEYERLAIKLLAARQARTAERTGLRELRTRHAAVEATKRDKVTAMTAAMVAAEQELGDYVRSTGMGDPEGLLRGTGQRLTTRKPKAAS